MKFNPIKFGENIKIDLALSYIKSRGLTFKNFLDKLVPEDSTHTSFQEKLEEFIKVKGPYIQALNLPVFDDGEFEDFAKNLKTKFAPLGLKRELIDVFKEFGFKRLYKFQKIAIIKILSELKNFLITAPTGRGKTEAWLIPLIHLILLIKKKEFKNYKDRKDKRTKTKIVLIYPTKALAQDQFKRIVEYLSQLNEKLNLDQKISIGIYDGDTPSKSKTGWRNILTKSFQLYQCPHFNSNDKKCIGCESNLIVKYDSPKYESKRRPHVVLPLDECKNKINLDYLYITREDIKNFGVDILITNPDELNVQLLNINSSINREVFVNDPIFYIFDEIHSYSGIFGSYVSMLLKRLKAARNMVLPETEADFYVIGASATIYNKEELFSKITGKDITNFDIIQAESLELDFNFEFEFSEVDEKCLEYLCQENDFEKIDSIVTFSNYYSEFSSINNIASSEQLRNILYNYFIDSNNQNILIILMRYLYTITNQKPLTQREIQKELNDFLDKNFSINLEKTMIRTLFENLYTIGTISGFIENRSHLFVWPIDGYYGCIKCGKIYQNLVAECDCGEDFITKILFCYRCSDIFYESWYCPECNNIHASQINNEGLFNRFDTFYCPFEHKDRVECIKVIWKPYFTCPKCEKSYYKRNIPFCPDCIAHNKYSPLELIFEDETKYFFCQDCNKRFNYENIRNQEEICYSTECNYNLDEIDMNNIVEEDCACENPLVHTNLKICSKCGNEIHQKKILPWICKSCGKKYFEKAPPKGTCEVEGCRGRTFYLDGYFELNLLYAEVENPKRLYVKKSDEEKEYSPERINKRRYAFINQNFRALQRIDFNTRKKYFFDGRCEISRSKLNLAIGKRFRDISYTPIFTASRISQFLLRQFFLNNGYFKLEEALKSAKYISFADSVRDMNLLAENFFESETVLFIDQLIFSLLESAPNFTLSLHELHTRLIEKRDEWLKVVNGAGNDILNNKLKYKMHKSLLNSYKKKIRKLDKIRNYDNVLKAIINHLVMRKDSVRRFILEGISDFDIDCKGLTDDEKEYLDVIRNINSYQVSLNQVSYSKTKELLNVTKELIEESEDLEDDDIERAEEIKQEIDEIEKKIDGVKNKVEEILKSLHSKGIILKDDSNINYIVYSINPAKVLVNLVSENNPMHYNKLMHEFITKYEYNFLEITEKNDLTQFNLNNKDRIDFTKPFFSYRAFLLNRYNPCLLNSEAYKGETKTEVRRSLENQFKNNSNLNYISSGPAMEVGIDIGDLNTMLLYGTPPNINSYLQRIGRAGRKLKKSLIVSLSKRNPIDYYYYKKPYDLMTQGDKRVPINDKNIKVIETSLVWSILDYLSNKYFFKKLETEGD